MFSTVARFLTGAVFLFAAGLASAASDGGAVAASDGGAVLIRNVSVFDGSKRLGVRDVLVQAGKIASVGRSLRAPKDVAVVDGRGRTLLPGLIDAHVHAFPSAAADALRFGVTSEFDMFGLPDPRTVAARRAARASFARTEEADVWSAGRGVTLPGAHPTGLAKSMGFTLPVLDDTGDAAAFVKAEVDEGSDYIKIFQDESRGSDGKPRFARFSREQFGAIIAAAHANRRKAVVHVSREEDANDAFTLGADAIAHMFADQPASSAIVALARRKGATIIATLSVLAGASGDGAAARLAADPAIAARLSPAQAGMLAQSFSRTRPEILANALESVRRFNMAGVTILAGTDAPNPTTAHGPSIHQELELLVRGGMTPLQALAATTSKPAAFFGAFDRGRIAVGKRADLVLVDGDPTIDITATRRIVTIWKNGYPVDREKMPTPPHWPGQR